MKVSSLWLLQMFHIVLGVLAVVIWMTMMKIWKYIEFCLVYVVEFFFNEIIIDGDQQEVVFVHNGHPRPVTSKTAFKKEKGEMRNMHHKHRIRMYKNITSRP